jgi:FKBP-type peptidyl-prolyl cis-trans isomerase FkpA/FKBP-type peptidyl-prolyl cis-trans isomerase FklB
VKRFVMAGLALAVAGFAADAPPAGGEPRAPSEFPPSAFEAFGSAMGQSGHFGDLGWTDAQFGAFADGMRTAFQGKPVPMDDAAKQLAAETTTRIKDIESGSKGVPGGEFKLSAYEAFGSAMGQSGHFTEIGWSGAQFDSLIEGMRSVFLGKPHVVDDAGRQLAAETGRRITAVVSGAADAQEEFDSGKLVAYMQDVGKRLQLQMSSSGLGYTITPGPGAAKPAAGDTVVISCAAFAFDGSTKLPQLSSDRIRSRIPDMLPGFREGILLMSVGSHATFVFPPALSFGRGQWPDGVIHGSPIIFDVTLREIIPAKP